jgi:hypothetical protein
MTNLSKVLIIGLLAATSVTASVAAATFANTGANTAETQNVTIIYKSDSYWPVKGLITVDPCNLRACVEA